MATTKEILAGEGGSNLVETSIAEKIWNKAFDGSIVRRLTDAEPISMGRNAIPVQSVRPSAHVLSEGEVKKSSKYELGAKLIVPMKAQVQVRMSEEFVKTNPVNALAHLEDEFAKAITRQIDLAVLHGKQAIDGTDINISGLVSVSDTANEVTVPADRALIEDAVLDGEELLAAGGFYPSGYAFDPLGVTRFSRAATSGQRAFPELNAANPRTLSGFRGAYAAVSPTVSGRVDSSTDTGVLAIAGDWSTVKLGYNSDVEFEVIEFGDPDQSGRDLKAHNELMYRSEVFFGYTILDKDAFVLYKTESAGEPEA